MRQANPVRPHLCQLPSPLCPLLQPHKNFFPISWEIRDDKYSFRDSLSLLRRNLPDTPQDQDEENFHRNLNFPFKKNEKFTKFKFSFILCFQMALDLSMIAYVPFDDSYALIFETHLYQIGLNEHSKSAICISFLEVIIIKVAKLSSVCLLIFQGAQQVLIAKINTIQLGVYVEQQ